MLNKNCFVKLTCYKCEITGKSFVAVNLNEVNSYSQSIQFNISSTSSIPNEISSINFTVAADQDKIFRGSEPTVFEIIAIPSIFETNDPKLKEHDGETGYHIMSLGEYTKGSQYNNYEAQFGLNLHARINFILSENSLLTKQTLKVTPIILVSAILGSVFGIKNIVGGVMSFAERIIIEKSKEISKEIDKKKIEQLKEQISLIKGTPFIRAKSWKKQRRKIRRLSLNRMLKKSKAQRNKIAQIKPYKDLEEDQSEYESKQEEKTEYSKSEFYNLQKRLQGTTLSQRKLKNKKEIKKSRLTESQQGGTISINMSLEQSKDTIIEK